MKDLSKKYDSRIVEEKWYNHWLKKGYFFSTVSEKTPYTIVIPPPNVTGVLHMGHMLNNTIQDILIRRARMMGFNACWVPGTDHASIATENKVVQKLEKEGIKKSDLSREDFLSHAFKWKEKHGGIILEQLKKIGASCDWNRTKFTMDDDMSESVIDVFIDLYNKGYIYRGIRMVNWDPSAQTAISDEEVVHKEIDSKLYYIKYDIENSDEKLIIATTRPETILGDTAICVNPKDDRYNYLKGKKVIVPLIKRKVPIIFDEYVDMDFGTGALKITPAHDINDYKIGDKHGLESIDIFNDDGTVNKNGVLYLGKDRFQVRKEIAEDLKELGYLKKIEEYRNKVGFSERTNSVIEPKLSKQWFCKMEKLSKSGLENVINDSIKIHPKKYKNTYKYWMENIKDWCISRQLWWGQQIPAFYYNGNDFVVAKNKEEALKIVQEKSPELKMNDLKQDEDVLDTWFSSWLWPISVFDGIRNPNNPEINYYFPTNDLITGPDILFFWVARMVMAGYEYRKKPPFNNVYLTGIVRDIKGRKMSKTLGNSPDPLNLIEKYGADGVRVGMLLCSPAGNDLPFDESLCEQGRNFTNKIWNALRLVKGWEVEEKQQKESSKMAIIWFENKLNKCISEINISFSRYRISEALMTTYKLIWDDFCSWFLEIIKPKYGESISLLTYQKTIDIFQSLLKILHPFMPFITEELWHQLKEQNVDIIISEWPKEGKIQDEYIENFKNTINIVSSIRKIRKEKQIPKKENLELMIIDNKNINKSMDSIICKLGGIDKITYTEIKNQNSISFMVNSNEFFIPLSETIDVEEELKKLNKEIEYEKGFLKITQNKLNNRKFIENAPEHLVQNERKKLEDVNKRITILKNKISSFS